MGKRSDQEGAFKKVSGRGTGKGGGKGRHGPFYGHGRASLFLFRSSFRSFSYEALFVSLVHTVYLYSTFVRNIELFAIYLRGMLPVAHTTDQGWPISVSSRAKTEHFQILGSAHKFMEFKFTGNLICIYILIHSVINKHLLLESNILLYVHKVVTSYCLITIYIYC
jgi:hypothetical protein